MNENIYTTDYVKNLFNSMSKTYGFVNYISSFGFTKRWRKQFLAFLPIQKPDVIGYDLMTGMGENWTFLKDRINEGTTIYYVDISEVMLERAHKKTEFFPHVNYIKKATDVLNSDFKDNQADFIVSSFGLKTFSKTQQSQLAYEVNRLLKEGGFFSFVEISKPQNLILRTLFLFYLRFCIPFIGYILMGNSADYKMLGVYTEKFGNSKHFFGELKKQNLNVNYKNLFFGCATCVYGTK